MALFVTERDRKLLSKINRELIDDIIETKLKYYQLSEYDNTSNLYGESSVKFFKKLYIIPGLIEREDPTYSLEDGKYDYEQQLTVYFLRDYLLDHNIKLEPSNYLEWDNEFYEIDHITENKYFANKNPQTTLAGSNYGWDVTIKCSCHLIDRSIINLEEIRFA